MLCYSSVCLYLYHLFYCLFFFFKQKTAYEMRISDWSSDVCSSDLAAFDNPKAAGAAIKGLQGSPVDSLIKQEEDGAAVYLDGTIVGCIDVADRKSVV